MCLPGDVKNYIAQHMKDDAEHHRSMMSQEYHDSHPVMWGIIDWETWLELMEAQAGYSEVAANLVQDIPICRE
jgi:hypothetical protein